MCTTAMAGEQAPGNDPTIDCPGGFGVGSSCQGVDVGVAGCCDAMGDVLFCLGNGGGDVAGRVECRGPSMPQSCND